MTYQQTPRSGLRQALDEVNRVVERVLEVLDDSHASGDLNVQGLQGAGSKVLDNLSGELTRAAAIITARTSHEAWESRFGADGWPARHRRISDRLGADQDEGTVFWLDELIAAIAVGEWDEGWRLLGAPYALADWACWVPDRAAVVVQALEYASYDAPRSARQLEDLVEALLEPPSGEVGNLMRIAVERSVGDSAATRISLILVLSRVMALTGDDRAGPLIVQARRLLGTVRPGSEATLGRSILSTEAFVQRHSARAGTDGAADANALRSRVAADLAGIHEITQRQQVEWKAAGIEPHSNASMRQFLQEVQAMVDSLKDVAGCQPRLRALLEAPADELVLALATRLAREQQLATARELSNNLLIPMLAEPLRLPAAELELTIARGEGREAAELAGALVVAGDQAHWSGDIERALGYYTEALELRPDDPETLRSMADALQMGAPTKDPDQARDDLRRALNLCDRAEKRDPITSENSWALLVTRSAYVQLSRLDAAQRGDHLWAATACSVRALDLTPDNHEHWEKLADGLTQIGLHHTAHVAATTYRTRVGDTRSSLMRLVITSLNTGRVQQALDLILQLTPEPDEDAGWIDGLKGYAYSRLDRPAEAKESFDLALAASPWLFYRQWAAEHYTRRDETAAADLWRALWKDANLDDPSELEMAMWAAAYKGLWVSVVELADRLDATERHMFGVKSSALASGLANIVATHGQDGWDRIEHGLAATNVSIDLEISAQLARAMLARATGPRPDLILDRFDNLVAEHRDALSGALGPDDMSIWMERELVRVMERLDDSRFSQVANNIGRVVAAAINVETPNVTIEGAEDSAPSVEPALGVEESTASDQDRIAVVMPPSWFEQWEGRETEHEFFVRALPFARAAIRRTRPSNVLDRAVRVRTDPDCEPDRFFVETSDGVRTLTGINDGRWYCPDEWVPGLREERRGSARATPVRHDLMSVDPPTDASGRLSSWSSDETVARLVLEIAAPVDADTRSISQAMS